MSDKQYLMHVAKALNDVVIFHFKEELESFEVTLKVRVGGKETQHSSIWRPMPKRGAKAKKAPLKKRK